MKPKAKTKKEKRKKLHKLGLCNYPFKDKIQKMKKMGENICKS
jgi:hypothetical protein